MTKGGGGSGASGWSGSAASAADAGAVGGDQGGSSDVTGATAGSYPEGNSGAPPGVAGGTSGGNSGAPPGVAGGSSGGNSGAPPEIAGGSSGGNSDAPPGIAGGNPGGNSGALGGTAGGSSGGNSGAPGGTAGDNGTAGGAGSAVGTSTTCSQCPDFALCGTDGSCGSCTSNADCEQTDECSLGFCVPTTLPDWRLEIAPADWEALNTELDTELYVPCSLGANGIEYSEGCRVRLHGGSSREYDKRSFHFVFPNDVDHPGLTRKIILRSEWNDPSFMRNRLALETFRFYTQIPASRSRYVRLTLNGEYYGLFLEVERIGKEFLRHNGRSDEQSLYEADPIEGLEPGAAGMVPLPDEATYRAAYDRKIDEDGSIDDLVALIEDVVYADNEGYVNEGAPPTQHIREAVDIDAFVDYLAVLGAMRSSDHVRKNYFFSWQFGEDGQGRWEFYPWDLDLTYGCAWSEEDNTLCTSFGATEEYDAGALDPVILGTYPQTRFYNLLIAQVFADGELRERIEQRMCAIIESDTWRSRLRDYIDVNEALITAAAADDPNDRNGSVTEFAAAVEELRVFLDERRAYLRAELACP